MKKLLFFDIDGTLTDETLPPSERVVNALKAARRDGNKLFLNTGRSYSNLHSSVTDIGFDGIVCSIATHIIVDGQLLYFNYLDNNKVYEYLKFLEKNAISCVIEGEKILVGFGKRAIELNWPDEKIFSADEFRQKYSNEIVNKISIWSPMNSEFNNKFGSDLQMIDHGYAVEIMPKGCTKASGILRVSQHYNVDICDTVAFGDSPNDIDMIKIAGVGVAMGNARDTVKAVADVVTETIQNDGVAAYIEKNIL